MEFREDGTAISTYSHVSDETRTKWRVDGDRFAWGPKALRQSKLITSVDSTVRWLTGTSKFQIAAVPWKIETAESDQIVTSSNGLMRWTLVRKRPP